MCLRRDKLLYLMLIPFVVYYVLFYYLPFGGLRMAFMDYKPFLGMSGSHWVGFDKFREFFTGPYFWRIIRNTLSISGLNILFAFPVPIVLAILFNEIRSRRFRTAVQTISYMPHFISTVVIAGLVVNLLSPSTGIVNIVMQKLGIESVYFLTKPEYFQPIYVLQGIWASAGFSSIIYFSTLMSIDSSLYEAATIDGAGRWKQIKHVTLPGLLPTVGIMLLLQIGHIMQVGYEMIILLYQPITYETADVIGSFVYRVGLQNSDYSMSTAVGLFNGVISLILVMSANKLSKKISDVSIM
ncbi:ABC transporter permease subunit [Paenibacillus sp. LMG 31461]|uniref:ABC transporter permease subunit n=2 Tax=Paenibacillus plantarum TaxID=2654975 RepID=A0ABX1XDK2_9BACL|nr:ABC transporter permease subunit [Paenibacillus plantarum]